LSAEEQSLLDLIFDNSQGDGEGVALGKARGRVGGRGFKKFSATVREELAALGALDSERIRIRLRYRNVAIGLMILAVLLLAPAGFLANRYDGWTFFIPAAIGILSIVGFIFYGALTPLSNDGVRRAARWRAFQKRLREVGRGRAHLTTDSPTRVLPYAIALGLAAVWSNFMKRHDAGVPPWFQKLVASDSGAFPAFIAAGGAGANGGGAGVGAGAGAAGGASGAG
jgi:hypothetical protein